MVLKKSIMLLLVTRYGYVEHDVQRLWIQNRAKIRIKNPLLIIICSGIKENSKKHVIFMTKLKITFKKLNN